jgi:hypothetical protein
MIYSLYWRFVFAFCGLFYYFYLNSHWNFVGYPRVFAVYPPNSQFYPRVFLFYPPKKYVYPPSSQLYPPVLPIYPPSSQFSIFLPKTKRHAACAYLITRPMRTRATVCRFFDLDGAVFNIELIMKNLL